jgi:hypothetical protein
MDASSHSVEKAEHGFDQPAAGYLMCKKESNCGKRTGSAARALDKTSS